MRACADIPSEGLVRQAGPEDLLLPFATGDTEAREERDQQPLRAAHLHTPRPLPGCPGCHVLPGRGAGPTNPTRDSPVSREGSARASGDQSWGTWEDASSRCPAVEGAAVPTCRKRDGGEETRHLETRRPDAGHHHAQAAATPQDCRVLAPSPGALAVPRPEASTFTASHHVAYFEPSAKLRLNMDEAFEQLVRADG
ncbi:hypothetical protein AB1E18_015703 [Capra hircus]